MDQDLEDRILTLLPYSSKEDRILLYGQFKAGCGLNALAVLMSVVQGEVSATAEERATAIQVLGSHESAPEFVGVFAEALKDRDLFVQLLALMLLRRWDKQGEARGNVRVWLERRLKSRKTRKITDFAELPMAIGYFAGIGDLQPAARLFEKYDEQIVDRVDRAVLDHMWPRHERERWAREGQAERPDLSDLGDLGHSYQFYLRIDAQAAGIDNLILPLEPSAEDERLWGQEHAAEEERLLARTIRRLERRRDRAAT